jgi:hypothetical protein
MQHEVSNDYISQGEDKTAVIEDKKKAGAGPADYVTL